MLPKYLSSSHRICSHHKPTTQASPSIVIIFAFVACLFAISARSASAATFTVDTLADDAAKTACTVAPNDCSLRGAIAAANAAAGDDVISFSVTGTITLGGSELVILSNIRIQGPGAGLLTVSGNNASRVFFIGTGTAVELGLLTVTGGNGVSTFESGNGGGIYNNIGTLTIINSTISGNHPAFKGGGIFNHVGTATVINSTISGNSVNTTGGGIDNDGGLLTVISSTVSGNSVNGNGGGIFNLGNVTVTDSTVTGNSAGADGGGIHNFRTLTVTNSTVAGNRADSNGSGVGAGGGIFASTSASASETLNNSIVAGNFRGNGSVANEINGTINTASHNLIANFPAGGIVDGVNGNIVGANPMLAPLAHYGGSTRTYLLLPGSPAINAGDSSLLPSDTFDLDDDGNTAESLPVDERGVGFARSVGNPDIGAFERQATDASNPLVVDTLADDGTKAACTPAVDDCSLRGAISNANSNANTDDIYFAVTGTITLAGNELGIISNLNIHGPGAKLITVSGNNASRVFNVNPGPTVLLDGLTVTGGSHSFGAGILNGGTLTVSKSAVSGNHASQQSGGIYNNNGMLTVNNSTISGNTASVGGGIFSFPGTLIVTSSTISGNTGGGISNGGTATITSSTITANSYPLVVELGEHLDGGLGAFGNETLNNTIVAGNQAVRLVDRTVHTRDGEIDIVEPVSVTSDIDGMVENASYNIVRGHRAPNVGIVDGVNGNQVGVSAVLAPLADNGGPTRTHALLCGSPAIDKGKNFGGITTDQRGLGFFRTFDDPAAADALGGDSTDIGAFEAQTHVNCAPSVVNDSYSTNEDTPLLGNSVLANDSDPENDPLSAVLIVAPTHAASFALNSDGTFSYTPSPNFNGSDSFIYLSSDGQLGTNATVFINVSSVNDAPSFNSGGDVTVAEDSGPYGAAWASGISPGPSDESGQTLTFMVTGNTNPGLFSSAPSISSNGTLSFTPAANANGTSTITVVLMDDGGTGNGGQDTSSPVNFTITATPVNDAPTIVVAPGGSCSDSPSVSGTMNLTVGDIESPAGSLTLSGSSNNTALVPNANIVFGGSGANRTITITVTPKKTGTATITVLVSDGQDTGMVTITVIVGSDKNETLNGTAGADMIFGLGGKNTINGNAGNDLICGGNGVDTISGGDGDDTIDGGNGDDVLKGDAGNDILRGETGNDRLEGGGDNDTLTGGLGADFFSGGPGVDSATDLTPSQGDTQDGSIP